MHTTVPALSMAAAPGGRIISEKSSNVLRLLMRNDTF